MHRGRVTYLLAGLIGAAVSVVHGRPTEAKDIPAEHARKIDAAVSVVKVVKPKQPRRLLVLDRCDGYRHGSIPYCNRMLELMAERTGAFEAVFASTVEALDAEKLANFDGILFNNATRLKFQTVDQKRALMEFVRSGKGIIGIHAASDNFYDFPEAAEMMGGLFDGHPWGSGGTWGVKLDEPDHPLVAAFDGRGFEIKDEIYQIKGPYSRATHRVLLSLDMEHEATAARKGKRADKDNAVSWLKRCGNGRVFYCSFGHNPHVYWNEPIVAHYLAGIQYALGDLEVADTPSEPPAKARPAADK